MTIQNIAARVTPRNTLALERRMARLRRQSGDADRQVYECVLRRDFKGETAAHRRGAEVRRELRALGLSIAELHGPECVRMAVASRSLHLLRSRTFEQPTTPKTPRRGTPRARHRRRDPRRRAGATRAGPDADADPDPSHHSLAEARGT